MRRQKQSLEQGSLQEQGEAEDSIFKMVDGAGSWHLVRGFQNYRNVDFCCSRWPGLWSFVTGAAGH